MTNPEISTEAKEIASLLKNKENVFLTGAGGTGKTYLTNQILQEFKNPIVLGTTALAAVLVGGETIHSFFKLGISSDVEKMLEKDGESIQWMVDNYKLSYQRAENARFGKMRNMLAIADLLVLEEISMASGELLGMIHERLRTHCLRKIPILAVGDLMQLPPVKARTQVFQSPHWTFKTINLDKVHRTSDLEFIEVQHKVRMGLCDEQVLAFMKARKGMPEVNGEAMILTALNKEVAAYNRKALDCIEGGEEVFEALVEKNNPKLHDNAIENFIEHIPPEKEIRLKVGARVIITNNVYAEAEKTPGVVEKVLEYYNGQKGTYIGYYKDYNALMVMTDDQALKYIRVFPYEMVEHQAEEGKVSRVPAATVFQYPVRLAYAMTIHKSQGQTLDKVHINCRNIFGPGQFYVALSRATSAEGVKVAFFDPKKIQADKNGMEFYESLQRAEEEAV